MTGVLTYLEQLREIALDQHGLVTSAQAVEAGIPKTELPRLASRRRIERLTRGVYRIPQDQRTWWEDLPIADLPTTIRDCIESGTPTYLLRQALDRGARTSSLPAGARRELEQLLNARDHKVGQ